jgi:hypothetical protein
MQFPLHSANGHARWTAAGVNVVECVVVNVCVITETRYNIGVHPCDRTFDDERIGETSEAAG